MFQVIKRNELNVFGELRSSNSRGSAKWKAPTIIRPNRSSSSSFTHMSGHNILPLKNKNGGQQQAGRIRAADTCVMPQTLPRNFRFEDIAPKVHVSGKEVRTQMLEELYAPNN